MNRADQICLTSPINYYSDHSNIKVWRGDSGTLADKSTGCPVITSVA